MATICPSCGRLPPEDARFCPGCGFALIEYGGRERKYATALFADLVGSTALAERTDPELVQEVATRVFDRMGSLIERYGGVIDNYMGDGILAVFGVPVVHEDDPERAVRAALEMQATLSEVNGVFRTEGKPEVAMRIGLEAGDILVDPDRPDRRVSGDVVNVAARLESVADPGTVLAGPLVHAATHRVIDYQALPALEVKGKAQLVTAWRALRVASKIRGERPGRGLRARLVGREEELSLLRQAFRRVQREGNPTLVTILGPAGSGKSRLVRELREWLDELDTDVYWREGRSLAYANVSYSALAEAFKAQCELLEDDPPAVVASKVARAIGDLFDEAGPTAEVLALVGAAASDFEKERLFESWRLVLEKMAARYPVVLVLEDFHWADAGLVEFVDHAADWARGAILIVTLARPELLETHPGWGGGKRNYSAVYLTPLTNVENRSMLLDLVGGLPDELVNVVVERAEGNPLFTEELARVLIDQGLVEADGGGWKSAPGLRSFEIPRSITALIATRIDLLPTDEKVTLQNAAVVGRTAWSGAIAALSEDPGEVRALINALRAKDLLVPSDPSAFSGEQELWFRHVLIRDVAYESLPKRDRVARHVRVAMWAAERAGTRNEDLAELIASHYQQAWRYMKELETPPADRQPVAGQLMRWGEAAGGRAERLWQKSEAAGWYELAIETAEATGASASNLARLHESFARAGLGIRPSPEVVDALERALDLYELTGHALEAGRVETALGWAVWESGRDAEGLPWFDKAVGRLRPLGSTTELGAALMLRGDYLRRHGEIAYASTTLTEAVEVARAVGNPQAEAWALHYLGISYSQGMDPTGGLAHAEEALAQATELEMLDLRARAAMVVGERHLIHRSDYRRAEELLRSSLEQALRAGFGSVALWARGNLMTLLWMTGRFDESFEMSAANIEHSRALAYPVFARWALASQGYVRLLQGDVQSSRDLLDRSGMTVEDEEAQSIPYAAVFLADLAEAEGRPEEATAMNLDAIDRLSPSFLADIEETLYFDAIRRLLEAGRAEEAEPIRERLANLAEIRPHASTYARWADGLSAADAEQEGVILEEVVASWEVLGRPIDQGRSLLDLAHAVAEKGGDPIPILAMALDLFETCGAELYAREARRRLGGRQPDVTQD